MNYFDEEDQPYIEPDVDIALLLRTAREGITKAEVIRTALRAAASGSLMVKPRARGVSAGREDLGEHTVKRLVRSGLAEP